MANKEQANFETYSERRGITSFKNPETGKITTQLWGQPYPENVVEARFLGYEIGIRNGQTSESTPTAFVEAWFVEEQQKAALEAAKKVAEKLNRFPDNPDEQAKILVEVSLEQAVVREAESYLNKSIK
jgi:hypothetical protein